MTQVEDTLTREARMLVFPIYDRVSAESEDAQLVSSKEMRVRILGALGLANEAERTLAFFVPHDPNVSPSNLSIKSLHKVVFKVENTRPLGVSPQLFYASGPGSLREELGDDPGWNWDTSDMLAAVTVRLSSNKPSETATARIPYAVAVSQDQSSAQMGNTAAA